MADQLEQITAPTDTGGRGSDLAVTAPELNAGAGAGRLDVPEVQF